MPLEPQQNRPVIFDYRTVPQYLQAMLQWNQKSYAKYSIRRECAGVYRCSPSLVTRVIQGKRRLTPDRVDAFGRIFKLNPEEKGCLNRWVSAQKTPAESRAQPKDSLASALKALKTRASGQNHLLSNWLNPYIKDLIHLRGFKPEPRVIHRMLNGIATIPQIERSLKFLFHQGFLRKTIEGKTVENNFMVTVRDDPSDEKLRAFHRKVLEIGKRNLSLFPADKRRDLMIIAPLSDAQVKQMRELLREYYENILRIIEDSPAGEDNLYQIMLYLTPIGRATP